MSTERAHAAFDSDKRVAMLVMHFGHPVPEMHSHYATSDYAATVLRPQRRTTMRCDTTPTMTLRRDASPASPVDAPIAGSSTSPSALHVSSSALRIDPEFSLVYRNILGG